MEGKCEWTKTVELPNPKYKGNKYEVCKLKKSQPQSQTSPNLNSALESDDEFLFNYIKEKLPDTETLFEKDEKKHYISASIKLFTIVNKAKSLNDENLFGYIDDIRNDLEQFQTFMTNIKTSLLKEYTSQIEDGIYLLRFTEKHPFYKPTNAYTNNKDDLLKRLINIKVINEDTFKKNIETQLSLDDNEKQILNLEMQSLLDWINVAEKFVQNPIAAIGFGGKTNYKQTPKRVHLSDSRPNAIIFQYPPSKIQYVKVKGQYLKIADAKKFLRKCI